MKVSDPTYESMGISIHTVDSDILELRNACLVEITEFEILLQTKLLQERIVEFEIEARGEWDIPEVIELNPRKFYERLHTLHQKKRWRK